MSHTRCVLCGASFNSLLEVIAHGKEDHPVQCVLCPNHDKFNRRASLLQHYRYMHTHVNAPIKCRRCGLKLYGRQAYLTHKREEAGAAAEASLPKGCPYCKRRFANAGYLSLHINRSHVVQSGAHKDIHRIEQKQETAGTPFIPLMLPATPIQDARRHLARMMFVSATKDLEKRKMMAADAIPLVQALIEPHKEFLVLVQHMERTDVPSEQDNLLWNAYVILCRDKGQIMKAILQDEMRTPRTYIIPHAKIWLMSHLNQ